MEFLYIQATLVYFEIVVLMIHNPPQVQVVDLSKGADVNHVGATNQDQGVDLSKLLDHPDLKLRTG